MKKLTKKQVSNLNKAVNANNDYITTSVCDVKKSKYDMTVEVLVHTKKESKSIFVTLNSDLYILAVNGCHSVPSHMRFTYIS